jgi:hypothetical protein
MFARSILLAGIALLLICLLGPGIASASVKCRCNNGTITEDMSSDYDDDDLDAACDDACSDLGGGRLWSPDTDDNGDNGDDVTIRPGERRRERATPDR